MSDENANKQSKIDAMCGAWNCVLADYQNSDFNKYDEGPGAELEALGRSGDMNSEVPQKIYLVVRNLPTFMTTQAMHNMCARFGKVIAVRDSKTCDFYFVDLPTLADMLSVYRGLQQNSYGFTVEIGRNANYNPTQADSITTPTAMAIQPVARPKETIDLTQRIYRPMTKNSVPRPHIEHEPLFTDAMPKNDPRCPYTLIEGGDAHELERAGFNQDNNSSNVQGMGGVHKKISSGIACVELTDTTKKSLEKIHQSCDHYDPISDCYQKNRKDGGEIIQQTLRTCRVCQHICGFACSRCDTPYCSAKCQDNDWPNHRYICGKPKNLQRKRPSDPKNIDDENKEIQNVKAVPSKTQSISNPGFIRMPGAGTVVRLTCVNKTNVVFIRSKTPIDNTKFFTIISDIHQISKTLSILKDIPKEGQIVVAQFKNQFKRAMVLNNKDKDRIKLIYIDYGNLDVKSFKELLGAPQRIVESPRFAIPVVLRDVPDCVMTVEMRTLLYAYLEKADLKVLYQQPDDFIEDIKVYRVELIDTVTNRSLNKIILDLCTPIKPRPNDTVMYMKDLEYRNIPEGENIDIVVMDNSLLGIGLISCATKECVLEIQKIQLEIQRYAESLEEKDYAPRIDELCIAKYDVDNNWYRGCCLELAGDGFPSILFIDYGNVALVNMKYIRPYPATFTFPIYTVCCEIKGVPEECDVVMTNKLEQLIPHGSTIHCDRVKFRKTENTHILTMNKVLGDFLNMNLKC